MAFSLQGFGAGFASKLSQRLDEDRIRQEKLQDEARREATRVRLAKQAERKRKQEEIDEYTGLLASLGVDPTKIESIANNGISSLKLHSGYAKTAFEKGKDYNSMLSIAPSTDLDNPDTSEIVSTTTGETTQAIPTGKEKVSVSKLGGVSIDREALSSLFVDVDLYGNNSELKSAYLQKKINAELANNTELANKYTKILDKIYAEEKREAALAVTADKNYASHTASTLNSAHNTMLKLAANNLGASIGEFGSIEKEFLGDPMFVPMQRYLAGNYLLGTGPKEDKPLQTYSNGAINQAIIDINRAALNKKNQLDRIRTNNEDFEAKPNGATAVNGVKYFEAPSVNGVSMNISKVNPAVGLDKGGMSSTMNYGDTVVMQDDFGNTRILVYTGVPNPSAEGAPYLIVQ